MLTLETQQARVQIPRPLLLAMAARHKSLPANRDTRKAKNAKDAFQQDVIACCNAAFDPEKPEHHLQVTDVCTKIWER